MKTSISDGNIKLGSIPNVSLPPIKSCVKSVPCAKHCYALKAFKLWPSVRTSWGRNYELALHNRIQYFADIDKYLTYHKPAFFRWHSSGDILDANYFNNMVILSRVFPDTKFLVFTKNYKVINDFIVEGGKIPKNLNVIFSGWPGWEINNPHNFPIAYVQNGNENRIPIGTKKCPGSCENCKTCFTRKQNVYFMIH